MAYSTGTATNHTDLWDKLLAFLQTDTALVAAGQQWTAVWSHATLPELVLQGPGLDGDDQVFVGLSRRDDQLTVGESVIDICGCTGIIPTAPRFYDHVNALPRRPLVFLDQAPMQYWFVANGRRFVAVIKISTIYQALYGGFFLPYSQPDAYPYPLFIGGTRGFFVGTSASAGSGTLTWRASTHSSYRQFAYPIGYQDSVASQSWDSQALMLAPEVSWRSGSINQANTYSLPKFLVGPALLPSFLGDTFATDIRGATYSTNNEYRLGYESIRERLAPGLNDEVALIPITLSQSNEVNPPQPVTYGVLDGCYAISGFGQTAENIITLGGVDHLVVPNVQRTGLLDYWALALE